MTERGLYEQAFAPIGLAALDAPPLVGEMVDVWWDVAFWLVGWVCG